MKIDNNIVTDSNEYISLINKIIFLFTFLFGSFYSFGQSSFVSIGDDVTNINGTYNYSVGEPFCNFIKDEKNNNVQFGVQQTFPLFILEKDKVEDLLVLFPNPVLNFLKIKYSKLDKKNNIIFNVYSIDGKLCLNGFLKANEINEYNVEFLAAGKYYFVLENNLSDAIYFIKL